MSSTSLFIDKLESWAVLEKMLREAKRADAVYICSFAMAEGFARRLLKQRENIGQLCIFLDFTIAQRNRSNALFISDIADELWLCNSHAKLLLVESASYNAVAVLSANATMNQRYESCMLTTDMQLVSVAKKQLIQMKKDSAQFK